MKNFEMSQRFVTSITREDVESEVVESMQKLGWQVVFRALDLVQVLAFADKEEIDLVLVGADRPDGPTLISLMERGIRVVGIVDSPLATPRFQACGVADLVRYETRNQEQLLSDLGALFKTRITKEYRHGIVGGRVFCVTGAAGAPGRTSMALNLAMESADLGHLTLLAEIDRNGGTLAQQLGLLNSTSTLNRAIATQLPINQVAPAIAGNFYVLTAPLQPVLMSGMEPELAADLWRRARSEFDISIIDVGSVGDLSESTQVRRRAERVLIETLAQADGVLMVVTPDPQSVARTIRALDALHLEIPDIKIQLIANRMPQKVGRGPQRGESLPTEVMAELVERALAVHQVPLDPDLFNRALAQGRAISELAPRSLARKAIRKLAQDVWQTKVA